jgi:hypothetical protein
MNGMPTSLDYYRTFGFFPYVGVDTEVIDVKEVNWWTVPKYDVVLVPRPCTMERFRACQIVKELEKILWVDFDDDMMSLPDDFEADKNSVRKFVTDSVLLSDLVICSTETVASLFKDKKTVVRKNIHNDYLFRFDPQPSFDKTFGFRGTDRVHKWNVAKFRKIFEEGDWIFWGGGMKEFYGKHLNELPFIDYMVSLRTRHPGVMVKPLADIPHNRAKSNCAWLEATYAGSVCLAPDWPEWQEPGILNYSDVKDCKEKMEAVINDIGMRMELFEVSVKTIKEKYLISNVVFRPEEYGL